MKRFVLVLVAACGPHTSSTTVGNSGGPPGQALAVELGDAPDSGEGFTKTLVASKGSTFPAISEDGHTIVDLVADAQDFSGIPVATVMFWTKDGLATKFRLESGMGDEGPPAE